MQDPEETTPLGDPTGPEATSPLGTEPESGWMPLDAASLGVELPERFARVRPLGEGGAGLVWLVEDRQLGRRVALKILSGGAGHPVVEERFRREARTAASLRHENLVRVHDAGLHEGSMWIAMEAIEGGSMEDWLNASDRDPREIAGLLAKVADALQVVHDAGLVHRDVKPGNILVTDDGVPKLTDFGLVHDIDATRLTRTGATLGTPVYMAPEQIAARSDSISPRTDVHALGAVLYRALVGRPPHSADTAAEVFRRVTEEDPEPPTRIDGDIPRDLETIALVALSRDPRDRYASAAAFAEDVRRWLDGRPLSGRRPGRLVLGWRWCRRHPTHVVAAVVLLTIAGWAARQASEHDAGQRRIADDARRSLSRTLELGPARTALVQAAALQYADDQKEARRTSELVAAALAACDAADSVSPGAAETRYLRGRAYAASGRFAHAETALAAAVERDPDHGPARLHLARVLVMRALILNAAPARPHRRQARTAARIALTARARAALEPALARGLLTDPVEKAIAEAYVRLADESKGSADRLAEFCARARRTLHGRPGVEELAFLEGYAQRDAGPVAGVIARRPYWPEALFLRAVTNRLKGQVGDVESDCTRVLVSWPEFAPALVLRSSVRYARGQVDEARADLERAVVSEPRNVGAWTGLGLVHVRLREFDDAIAALDTALKLDPADAQSRVWRAESLSFLGRRDDALEEIDRAIALQPDLADAWYDKGLMQLRGDPSRIDEARPALEKVVELAKSGAKAMNARRNLCALHVMSGRTEDARRELDEIIKAYGRPEHAALLAAFVLEAEGRPEAAILALDRGLAARGDVAEFLLMRGRLRIDTGSDGPGLNDLRRGLDLPLSVRVPKPGSRSGSDDVPAFELHFYGRYLIEACIRSVNRRSAAADDARLTRRLDAVLEPLSALLR